MRRLLAVLGALSGMAGVSLMAAGSHAAASTNTALAGTMALMHAPALLALALFATSGRRYAYAGWVLSVGVALFCGDLAFRDAFGHALFPYAAPIGGTVLIAGWLGVAIAALFPEASRPSSGGME